ncbi:ectonucleoside triphosphate diphosphohydrolase 8-like isoform X1 [Lethenteron reissneri]|uniref:ectonucleoside triphosphate diphosphohydrolase 8-like isoform X1 n=1 Tax=Lethenteron reissneri TaxID=7753 RepID=UPI002AB7E06A|nr:ectonucleoside triphosphate diphosphohydrolase 8-like isoform X1 [Lethenteron reissneri]XP_061412272.1 ectonucleoside triphosphate diphosphohydrolase 8-like isoform X1 [Lethenteron reissneri]XP_061412273.1 ectonucleoside triphosphate diphosphohydrolase 8-like isoform X1 [Lethenteron reissneri]
MIAASALDDATPQTFHNASARADDDRVDGEHGDIPLDDLSATSSKQELEAYDDEQLFVGRPDELFIALLTGKQRARTTPRQRCLLKALGLALFVVLVTAIVSIAVAQSKKLPPPLKYGVVLDAGSSHTSLFVYQWPADKENDTGVVTQVAHIDVEGGGISSYKDNPEMAGQSLVPSLFNATKLVPPERHHETPISLGATAGMRLLRKQNPEAAERVMESVKTALRATPFLFCSARILTGQEEGAFGWVTINYLQGNFLQRDWLSWVRPRGAKTVGALDLGGASTQIAFVPAGGALSGTQRFRLYGYDHAVFTHSYLCYGKDEALMRVAATLARGALAEAWKNSSSDVEVTFPCYHSGFEERLEVGYMFGKPCTAALKPLVGPHGGAGPLQGRVLLRGSGQADKCAEAVAQIFNYSSCAGRKDCTFDGVYQPPVSGSFMAFSAFYYVMDFLKLRGEGNVYYIRDVVKRFCNKPWNEVRASSQIEQKHLKSYCFSANYLLQLLIHGYKFNFSTWINIKFVKKVEGIQAIGEAGWALGYMLNETNLIPVELAPRAIPEAAFGSTLALLSLLLAALLLAALAYTCVSCARWALVSRAGPPNGQLSTDAASA